MSNLIKDHFLDAYKCIEEIKKIFNIWNSASYAEKKNLDIK